MMNPRITHWSDIKPKICSVCCVPFLNQLHNGVRDVVDLQHHIFAVYANSGIMTVQKVYITATIVGFVVSDKGWGKTSSTAR
jgi:hypothetical protein